MSGKNLQNSNFKIHLPPYYGLLDASLYSRELHSHESHDAFQVKLKILKSGNPISIAVNK